MQVLTVSDVQESDSGNAYYCAYYYVPHGGVATLTVLPHQDGK